MDAHTGGRWLTHGNNSAGAGDHPAITAVRGDTLGHEGPHFPFGSREARLPLSAHRTTEKPDPIVLSQAIGNLLPSAIGVALSPVPIIAVILMLGTPKARSNGTVFALGWVSGLVAVSAIVLIVAGGAGNPNSDSATGVNWLDVFLGVLFLAMAARQWRGRPKKGEEATMPKWMAFIDGFGAGKSAALGVLLSGVNPKNLALTLAAAASIAQAGLSGGQNAVAVAVFVVIGSLSVAGPVLFFLLAPARAAAPLATIKEFMSDHNAVIMMVILLVLGLKLLGAGIGGLGR